jgi:hypothetical protein
LDSVFSVFFGLSAVTPVTMQAWQALLSKISINFEFLDCFLYFLFSMVYQLLLLSHAGKAGLPIKDINRFGILGLDSVFSIVYGLSADAPVTMQTGLPLSKISINFEFWDWILYFLFSMVYQLLLLSLCYHRYQ